MCNLITHIENFKERFRSFFIALLFKGMRKLHPIWGQYSFLYDDATYATQVKRKNTFPDSNFSQFQGKIQEFFSGAILDRKLRDYDVDYSSDVITMDENYMRLLWHVPLKKKSKKQCEPRYPNTRPERICQDVVVNWGFDTDRQQK